MDSKGLLAILAAVLLMGSAPGFSPALLVHANPSPSAKADFPVHPMPGHLGVPVLTNIPLQINVLFLGIPTDAVDTARIQTLLSTWYTQINRERYAHTHELEMYVNFTLSYKFIFSSSLDADAYSQFLISNHREDAPPPWLSSLTTTAWYIDAYSAETWMKNNLPIPAEGYTLILIDTSHTTPPVTQFHFYNGTQIDPDTGKTPKALSSTFMLGFGGDPPNRFLFLDLSAGPTCYFSMRACPSNADVNWVFNYDLTNPTDVTSFDNDLARYIQSAVDLRFAPSYLYHPIFRDVFYLNVTIFSGDPGFRYSDYINMTHMISVFRDYLLPLSNFTGSVREVPIEKDPTLSAVVQSSLGADGTLNASSVISYFLSNYRTYVGTLGQVKVIPIFILAGYQFSGGLRGEAVPSQTGKFAFVIEAMDQGLVMGGQGFTYLTLHESSHAFGLTHPHDGFDWAQGEFTFWAYDYSASITTYAIDNIYPDQMNYDQRDLGTTAVVLNSSYTLIDALSTLRSSDIPPSTLVYVNTALNDSRMAIDLISKPNPDYYNASGYARSALAAATLAYTDLSAIASSSTTSSTVEQVQVTTIDNSQNQTLLGIASVIVITAIGLALGGILLIRRYRK